MLVTYTAPNRAHHYPYAEALARAGVLRAFVSGFSRFSPRSPLPILKDRLVRADHVQNVYGAAMRLKFPKGVNDELAYLSKCWLDMVSTKPARQSDIFLFYNGAGLTTLRKLRGSGTIRIVEAVNSHVLVQQQILREEHERLGIPFRQFHARETARRVAEYEEADFVLGPSRFARDSFISQGLPPDRFILNEYGFMVSPRPKERPRSRKDEVFRVLYVGQIAVRKGLRYLLEAFALLKHPKKELLIVGPDNNEGTGIDDLTIPTGVRFTGVLKGAALDRAYDDASVFVLPSLEDGFGLVLGEALAAGLPIIATTNTGAQDLFENGTCGWVVPIRNPSSIAEHLQQLADDPELLDEMSHRALLTSRSLGGWETSGSRLVTTLQSALTIGKGS
jgi:glycosyltransferase involved in cell wall biosynthesis